MVRRAGLCRLSRLRSGAVQRVEGAKLSEVLAHTVALDEKAHFADLVEAIAARADRTAFARLFAYYGPRVKGYLLRVGLDAGQAEEQALDVMVAVWRKAANFDRRQTSVATWIFRIARNRRGVALDQVRLASGDASPANLN